MFIGYAKRSPADASSVAADTLDACSVADISQPSWLGGFAVWILHR